MRAEDKLRRFIISYRLSDDMITVYEKAQRNSGIIGGKFLERTRVCKPGSQIDSPDFYTPADFRIGAVIEIFKHRFRITDVDEYVLKYLESFPGKFPLDTINSYRQKLGKEILVAPADEQQSPSKLAGSNNSDANGNNVKTETQWRYVCHFFYLSRQKRKKVTLEEWVFVEWAFNMRCHIFQNTLLHTAFSAILPAGMFLLLRLHYQKLYL